MFKKLALGAVAVVVVGLAGLVAVASTKPDTFVIKRTATLAAPVTAIQPLLTDFHEWPKWSPFEKMDPNMKRTFSGAPKGKGAIYAWSGNGEAGEGRMEILDVTPEKVTIKLEFTKPMAASNIAEFATLAKGEQTEVTWSMSGASPLINKCMDTLIGMDKMVGPQFEQGLASLGAAAKQ